MSIWSSVSTEEIHALDGDDDAANYRAEGEPTIAIDVATTGHHDHIRPALFATSSHRRSARRSADENHRVDQLRTRPPGRGLALRCDGDGCGTWTAAGGRVDFCQVELGGFHPAIATHVARHDTARVLRETQAHRTTVDEYEIALWAQADADQAAYWQARRDTLLESCLRIAAVYADHPEYRVEWSSRGASDLP